MRRGRPARGHVRGLVWRSHLDRFQFSEQENRHLGEEIEAAGGECLLDMRVRPGGSHHRSSWCCATPGRPERDVAFVGGIDLCHSRRDDADHLGDPQRQPMAAVYGPRPPWHDVQLTIRGPAVGDVETVFRERWKDPAPLTRNPLRRAATTCSRRRATARPAAAARSCPTRRRAARTPSSCCAPTPGAGAATVRPGRGAQHRARLPQGAVPRARSLIYLEDQYLWSARRGRRASPRRCGTNPDLQPDRRHSPASPTRTAGSRMPPNLIGPARRAGHAAPGGRDRVAVYGLENEAGTPVYVHAKVCVDRRHLGHVGSDNFNRRSWTHDSELQLRGHRDHRDRAAGR